MMVDIVNLYSVLGVPRGCSEDDVRRRFRELARDLHPDRFPPSEKAQAERRFQEITLAFNTLVNPARREAHDFDLDSQVNSASDPKMVARAYIARGVEEYRAGNWEAAVLNFEMAANHDPEDAGAQHYLAVACTRLPNRIRQSVLAIEKALQKDPRNREVVRDAARIYRSAGLWAKAERYFTEALRWFPDSAELRRGLEHVRAHRGSEG